jgi:L-threonylcarbamoyladenylate synthase
VACPTESFYGLAADAANEAAVERLFRVKQRRPTQPLLILIPYEDALTQYARAVPETARKLISEFWPGGVTLVFHAAEAVSPLLTAGTGRIGIRFSSHPLATSLTRAAGVPITGTSANLSGLPSCSTAEAVREQFGDALDLILDGGPTLGGKGSTVLDVTVDPPRILREGLVSREALSRIAIVE